MMTVFAGMRRSFEPDGGLFGSPDPYEDLIQLLLGGRALLHLYGNVVDVCSSGERRLKEIKTGFQPTEEGKEKKFKLMHCSIRKRSSEINTNQAFPKRLQVNMIG